MQTHSNGKLLIVAQWSGPHLSFHSLASLPSFLFLSCRKTAGDRKLDVLSSSLFPKHTDKESLSPSFPFSILSFLKHKCVCFCNGFCSWETKTVDFAVVPYHFIPVYWGWTCVFLLSCNFCCVVWISLKVFHQDPVYWLQADSELPLLQMMLSWWLLEMPFLCVNISW